MKKQYIFLVIIVILFHMLYLISSYKYREYKINSHIEEISKINLEIENSINTAKELIEYKNTLAYKNKMLKQEQGLKNKNEKVIYLTDEKKYKTFTNIESMNELDDNIIKQVKKENDITENMTNIEKWKYFILKKTK